LPLWQNHAGHIIQRFLWLACLALTLVGASACHRRTSTTSSVSASVELFAVTFDAEGVRYWRDEQPLSRASGAPENTVRALLTRHATGSNTPGFDARMIHSTSWRYEDRNRIVLTYLAYLPPQSPLLTVSKRLRIEDIPGQAATDALHPRPPHIAELDVLGHGLRHLAFLMTREPDGAVARALDPAGRMLLWRLTPTVAGQLSAP
jgi:hypothetical protein